MSKNLKKDFGDIFPWHYNPMTTDHDDAPRLPRLNFNFDALVKKVHKLCELQGDPRKNNRGFSYYLDDQLAIDNSKFLDRDETFKKMMSLWADTGWNADNSCFWEFHDTELEEFYEPLLSEYSVLYPNVKNSQIRVFAKPPMTALGLHADTYGSFTRKYDVPKEKVFRVFTFAQDWDWGHYFLLGNHVCHQYTAGDSYRIKPNVWHLSANNGVNTKITINFTGTLDD